MWTVTLHVCLIVDKEITFETEKISNKTRTPTKAQQVWLCVLVVVGGGGGDVCCHSACVAFEIY